MLDEEKELSNKIKEILDSSITSDRSIFYRAMNGYEYEKTKGRRKYSIFKILAPVALALIIVTTSIFPVFGDNGSLVDVYNSYRVNREISNLRTTPNNNNQSVSKNYLDLSLVELKSFIEKELKIDPAIINKLYIHELDEREIVTVVLISKITKRDPIDVMGIRKKNRGWGIILRQNQINPTRIIQELREIRSKLKQETRHYILRGTAEAFSETEGALILDNYPFKIYLANSTVIENPLILGKHYDIEADYNSSNNVVQAVKISESNLPQLGLVYFQCQILDVNYNSITVKLRDGSTRQVFMIPRTIIFPSIKVITPGSIVRVDAIINNESQLFAQAIKGIRPPVITNNNK